MSLTNSQNQSLIISRKLNYKLRSFIAESLRLTNKGVSKIVSASTEILSGAIMLHSSMSKHSLTCLRRTCSIQLKSKRNLHSRVNTQTQHWILHKNLNLSSLICNFLGNVVGFCGVEGKYTIKSASSYRRTSIVLQDFGTSEVTFIIM